MDRVRSPRASFSVTRSARASETSLQRQVEDLSAALVEAETSAGVANRRAELAEDELAVFESALLRLLRATGSKVADRRDVRQFLGLDVSERRVDGECARAAGP